VDVLASEAKTKFSALTRPYSGYHRAIERKAGALIQSVATNHGFIDGNTRTSIILTDTLITLSGYRLVALRGENIDDAIEDFVLSIVNDHLPLADIVAWFRVRIR
jgi:prophage maintenance system killer protein